MRAFGMIVLPLFLAVCSTATSPLNANDYAVVDSGQNKCFDTQDVIPFPAAGQPFHGQDAMYPGNLPSYTVSPDGLTVHDHHTGLTWQKTPDTNDDGILDSADKLTWIEFNAYPAQLNAQNYGGFSDWRLPTIKELYSLIDFRGIDPDPMGGGTTGLRPFIDRNHFDFAYGDPSIERIIDAQYWSNTEYVGKIFLTRNGVFGVNFADGRIKCYPRDLGPSGSPMTEFVRLVRGNSDYGVNSYIDNGDGTITDQATGLMWMRADSGAAYDWEDALDYAEKLVLAKYDDWRLPNAKELQSIVDYTRSPSTTGSAAIDPIFQTSMIIDETGGTNYPFYWSGTTHISYTGDSGRYACYVAFGEALGYMGPQGAGQWMDVHGAGAQRSDPKAGDPNNWPYGHGPQGDAIRIYNHVRCVRGGIGTALQADAYTLSAASGGVIDLKLDAGASHAGRSYFVLGSLSGMHPGIPLGSGVTVPLNLDLFTYLAVELVNSPACVDFSGTLDGLGGRTATLNAPGSLPAMLAGESLYFAYLLCGPLNFASNPIAIEFEP